jgi:hypothetical protein
VGLSRKFSFGLLIALGGAVGWYQLRVIRRQEAQMAMLATDRAGWQQKIRQLSRERDEEAKRLAALQKERERLGHDGPDSAAGAAAETVVKLWLSRVHQLRQRLESHPDQKIPELRLASEQDWLDVARGELSSDDDYRQALSKVRASATNKFIEIATKALKKYSAANDGNFPTAVSQLQPYFTDPADAAILQRYVIIPENQIPYLQTGDDKVMTQNGQVDQKYDPYIVMLAGGGGVNFSSGAPVNSLLNVLNAYMAANQSQMPSDPAQLLSYATTPEQQSVVQKAIQHTIRPSLIMIH